MKNVFLIILLTTMTSCKLHNRKAEVFMADKDYIEIYRRFSPDSSKLLINFSLDHGAFGSGGTGTAIIKVSDTAKNLREYWLPETLTGARWLDNQNVYAEFDIIPSIREGKEIEIKDTVINNIKIKISALDYIDEYDSLEIVHKEVSPNKKFELVAYRYGYSKPLHISIIESGTQIPKYGNYFIATKESDYIFFGKWTENNELEFFSNNLYSDLIKAYLVKTRKNVNYKIITDDKKYGRQYRWREKKENL